MSKVHASSSSRAKKNGTIRAGVTAIRASDNARVNLIRCDISGYRLAIRVSDNAEVKAVRATVRGSMRTSENGTIVRKRSKFIKRPIKLPAAGHAGSSSARASADVRVGPGGTRTRAGGTSVRVGPGGTHARAGRTSVRVGPGGTHVRADRTSVRVGPGGTAIRTKGVQVRTGPGAAARTGGGAVIVSVRKPRAGLRNQGAFVCGGTKNAVIRNRYISARGTAVLVNGSCELKLITCHIVGGDHGIRVTGSGDVVLKSSYVQGKRGAISISGSGDVNASNSVIYGQIRTRGSGDFNNKGNNKIHKNWR